MIIENRIYITILASVFILLLLSCYEKPEGCTDSRAINYDVKADQSCDDDCCKYPDLELNIDHQYEGSTLDTNIWIQLGPTDSIRIKSLIFFLSDFLAIDGNIFSESGIIESIPVGHYSEDILIFDNSAFSVAKIKLGNSSAYNLGTFKNADQYDGLAFDFGLKDEINYGDLQNIASSNPLYQNIDSMYIDASEGFYFLKMLIDYNSNTEKLIEIKGSDNVKSIFLEHQLGFEDRSSRVLEVIIDYTYWFDEIDFLNDSTEIIAEKLIANIEKNTVFR